MNRIRSNLLAAIWVATALASGGLLAMVNL
jgi:hypothetical protein